MTTLSDIIARGYRRPKIIGDGDTPSPSENVTGLEMVQGILTDLLVTPVQFTAVTIEADYTAGENERIFNIGSGSETITLPETIDEPVVDNYGHVISQTRPPRNGAVVDVAGAAPQSSVYIAQFGAWMTIQGLALTNENPLGPAYDHHLVSLLAYYLADEFTDKGPSQALQAAAQAAKTTIRQRFRQSVPVRIDPLINSPRLRCF